MSLKSSFLILLIVAALYVATLIYLELYSTFSLLLIPFLAEVSFFLIFRAQGKKHIYTNKHFADPFVKSHPHLPFVYSPNTQIPMLPPKEYDFMRDRFVFNHVTTDADGNLPGYMDKSNDETQVKIACLGDSVCAQYITDKETGKTYNFSLSLGELLSHNFEKKHFAVKNFAIGGYTLLEILVKFMIKDRYYNPDYIVLNHGYSNIRSLLYNNYKPDNSHFRKPFELGVTRYKLAKYVPFKNSLLYKLFFSPFLPSDIKDFLKFISLNGFSETNNFHGLDILEENLNLLVDYAQTRDIKIILCTCPHFLHAAIKKNYAHRKFHEGMKKINAIVRRVAKNKGCILVDNEINIEEEELNFIDSIHLSVAGIQKAVRNVSKEIAKDTQDA